MIPYLLGVFSGVGLVVTWALLRSARRREDLVDLEAEVRRSLEECAARGRAIRTLNGERLS